MEYKIVKYEKKKYHKICNEFINSFQTISEKETYSIIVLKYIEVSYFFSIS